MSPRPRFSLLPKKKQDSILDSATDEFGTFGYDGASINRIIKNAGISKGVAYYYFDDKKDLFATVIERAFEKLISIYSDFEISELTEDDFWPEIEKMTTLGLTMFRDQLWVRSMAKLFWNYVDNHPDSVAIRGVWSTVHAGIENILVHGQSIGVVRKDIPNELLISIFFGIGTALDRWMLDNMDQLEPEEFEELAVFIVQSHRSIAQPCRETASVKKTAKKKNKKKGKK